MILNYLKENTASIHKEIEKYSLAKYIINHTISKDSYTEFLIQNFKFYSLIEQELQFKHPVINIAFHPFCTTTKSESLKKDIATIGYDEQLIHLQNYSFQLNSNSAALGAMYVSEGSALGGLMISKQLKKCAELEFISQHYFFGNGTPAIMGRWKRFRQVVEENTQDDIDREEVLAAAIKTFQLFGQIMQE